MNLENLRKVPWWGYLIAVGVITLAVMATSQVPLLKIIFWGIFIAVATFLYYSFVHPRVSKMNGGGRSFWWYAGIGVAVLLVIGFLGSLGGEDDTPQRSALFCVGDADKGGPSGASFQSLPALSDETDCYAAQVSFDGRQQTVLYDSQWVPKVPGEHVKGRLSLSVVGGEGLSEKATTWVGTWHTTNRRGTFSGEIRWDCQDRNAHDTLCMGTTRGDKTSRWRNHEFRAQLKKL